MDDLPESRPFHYFLVLARGAGSPNQPLVALLRARVLLILLQTTAKATQVYDTHHPFLPQLVCAVIFVDGHPPEPSPGQGRLLLPEIYHPPFPCVHPMCPMPPLTGSPRRAVDVAFSSICCPCWCGPWRWCCAWSSSWWWSCCPFALVVSIVVVIVVCEMPRSTVVRPIFCRHDEFGDDLDDGQEIRQMMLDGGWGCCVPQEKYICAVLAGGWGVVVAKIEKKKEKKHENTQKKTNNNNNNNNNNSNNNGRPAVISHFLFFCTKFTLDIEIFQVEKMIPGIYSSQRGLRAFREI